MPVLAVCRGSQVLNVARGGDLVQHLPEVVGDEKHKQVPGSSPTTTSRRRTAAGSARSSASARRSSRTTTRASADRRGPRETAWAEDGTIEALEDPSRRFALGVLWHPEDGEDAALFRGARRGGARLPRRAAQREGRRRAAARGVRARDRARGSRNLRQVRLRGGVWGREGGGEGGWGGEGEARERLRKVMRGVTLEGGWAEPAAGPAAVRPGKPGVPERELLRERGGAA